MRKNIKSFFLLAAFFSGTVLFAENILKEGDFETNAGWEADAQGKTVNYSEEGAYSGKRCVLLDKAIRQGGLKLEKGKYYKLTLSIKCTGVPENGFNVKFLTHANGKITGWLGKNGVGELIRDGGTHDWADIGCIIGPDLIGEGQSGYVFLFPAGKGEILVDNVVLEETKEKKLNLPKPRQLQKQPQKKAVKPEQKPEQKAEQKPAAAAPANFVNLVKNADFESKEHWNGDSSQFEYVTAEHHSGKSCMKVNGYAYQGNIVLEKGKTYKLSVFAKCKDVPADGFCVKILQFENGKVVNWINREGVFMLVHSGGTHDWKEFSCTITPDYIGKGVTGSIYISHEKSGGELYVDDLVLRTLTEEELNANFRDVPNLWPYDGSFETATDLTLLPRDKSTAFDGKYSLRIDPGKTGHFERVFMLKKANHEGFVSFYVKADKPCKILAYTWNDSWTWNANAYFHVGTEWTRCILPQKKEGRTLSVSMTVVPQDKTATVWLDALSYTLDYAAKGYTPANPYNAGSSNPPEEGVLPISDKPVIHTIGARNNTEESGKFTFRASVENASTRELKEVFSKEITLGKGELFETSVKILPKAERGYYAIRTELLKDGKAVATHAQPFAVVDPPPPVRDDAFCGFHGLARNIGVSCVRIFQNWTDMPDKDGNYHYTVDRYKGLKGDALPFYCLNIQNAPASLKGADGNAPDDKILAWTKALASTYPGYVPAFELVNEPELVYPNKAEWYANKLNMLIPELRKVAPGVKIGGSGVSGVDFNQGFIFTEQVLKIAGKNLDIVPVHPYTYNHYVDDSKADIGPEGAKTYERAVRLRELIAKYGSKAEVWYGEVGWAPDVMSDFMSETNRRSASYIPRLFVLSKAGGVKKMFYFLPSVCLERERYNYGIWRAYKPLPAVAVYAATAQAIEYAKPLKVIANQDYHAFTFKREDGKLLACLWMSNLEKAGITLKLPKGAEVRDMFWNPVAVKDNSWELSGEMSYVLVSGMSEEQFNALIAGAKVEMPPLKAVWQLSSGKIVDLTLHNLRTVEQEGTLEVTGVPFAKSSKQKFKINGAGTQLFRFEAGTFLSGKTLTLRCKSNFGSFESSFSPTLMECPTWSIQDFKADAMPKTGRLPNMDTRKNLLPNDPTNGWDGPQNLSVKSAIGHDRENLYLRIDVRDNIHFQNRKPGVLWAEDSIQLAIDSKGDASGIGFDKNDYEFGFGLTPEGPQKELTYTYDTGRADTILENVKVKIKRVNDVTRYWIMIPWNQLKINPDIGTVFGLNFTANDNEGFGLRFWMGITPGIVDSKNPGVYRKFILTGASGK